MNFKNKTGHINSIFYKRTEKIANLFSLLRKTVLIIQKLLR